MEFVRERRAWEERLKKKAPIEAEVGDSVDEDMGMEGEAVIDMPSPTEDREIEELLSYLGTDQRESPRGDMDGMSHGQGEGPRNMGSDTLSDDDDYDQLFMEVIGEGEGSFHADANAGRELRVSQQSQDSSMDLS